MKVMRLTKPMILHALRSLDRSFTRAQEPSSRSRQEFSTAHLATEVARLFPWVGEASTQKDGKMDSLCDSIQRAYPSMRKVSSRKDGGRVWLSLRGSK